MTELIEWLNANKIQHKIIDEEVIEIPGMGLLFYEDTTNIDSIFRKNLNGELVFNSVEEPDVLLDEGIEYIVFKFGDNWYYTNLKKDFALNILKYVGQRAPSVRSEEFVHLGVHTPFELLNGSFMPKDWVKKAKYLGHTALGVCDKNTMASLYSFQRDCDGLGIKPVFGYSFDVSDGLNVFGGKIYVQTQTGLRNLLRVQKAIMVDSENKTIDIDTLLDNAEGNIFVFDKYSTEWLNNNTDWIQEFKQRFKDIFYQVDLSEYKAERIDIKVLECTKQYFDNSQLREAIAPILISDSYYLDKDDAKNKIILNKIAEGAAHEQSDDQYFKDVDDHYAIFEQIFDARKHDVSALFAECCANTVKIANGAVARFDNTRNFMPQYDMTEEEKAKYGTTHNMFNQLLEEGLNRLVPVEKHEQYRKQMEYEKYIIESTNNVDYLLVQYDTVNFCKRQGILVGCGRGSAAGSLLLYLLGITLIDPIKYDLIFERFLLPERAGLYPAQTTILGQDIESLRYVEITLENGMILKVDVDASLIVQREGEAEPIVVYADELQANDDILFDNKDILFTINEI